MLRTRLIAGVTSGFVLSAVFATAAHRWLNFGETFFEPWRVDPARPAPITLRMPRTARAHHRSRRGEHSRRPCRSIVARGEIVADPTLASLVRALRERPPAAARARTCGASWLVQFILVHDDDDVPARGQRAAGALLRTQVGLVALALLLPGREQGASCCSPPCSSHSCRSRSCRCGPRCTRSPHRHADERRA